MAKFHICLGLLGRKFCFSSTSRTLRLLEDQQVAVCPHSDPGDFQEDIRGDCLFHHSGGIQTVFHTVSLMSMLSSILWLICLLNNFGQFVSINTLYLAEIVLVTVCSVQHTGHVGLPLVEVVNHSVVPQLLNSCLKKH